MTSTGEKLRISDLHAYYGESHILHGIDMTIMQGELVTLLGRNGAGRSTTLKAIMNMVGRRTGKININGNETIGMAAHKIAHLGVGYCPEERGIFSSLNVEENLMLPPNVRSDGMSIEEIYDIFPNLAERRYSRGLVFLAGSSRCWRWHVFCGPAPIFCCSMRLLRVWPRSSYKSWLRFWSCSRNGA